MTASSKLPRFRLFLRSFEKTMGSEFFEARYDYEVINTIKLKGKSVSGEEVISALERAALELKVFYIKKTVRVVDGEVSINAGLTGKLPYEAVALRTGKDFSSILKPSKNYSIIGVSNRPIIADKDYEDRTNYTMKQVSLFLDKVKTALEKSLNDSKFI